MDKAGAVSRWGHACLVTGGGSDQILAKALEMAQRAVCQGEGERPCGRCPGCRKAQAGIHPDIIRISRPEDDKGQKKKEIAVGQIRAMAADACVLPNEAPRKVYIIEEAETMNVPAQNAALKLLEEPPLDVQILLCTVNPGGLLPTVRSRCTVVSCGGGRGEARTEEASLKLAKAYLEAVAKGSRKELLSWCAKNEDMDLREAGAFLEAVTELLAGSLEGKGLRLELDQALRLSQLMDRCKRYQRSNVGVKHIFGLLAVSSIA